MFVKLVAMTFAIAIAAGCGDGASGLLPTAPTGISAASATGTGPTAEPTTPPGPGATPGTGTTANTCAATSVAVTWNGASEVTLTNRSATCTAEGVFALFRMPDPLPRFETQELFDFKGFRLAPGATVSRLGLNEPECGEFQGDVLLGVTDAQVRSNRDVIRPPHADSMLVGYRFGDTGRRCQPPTPVCEGVGANLTLDYDLNASPVPVTLYPRLIGAGVTGRLLRNPPESSVDVADRQVITTSIARPAAGSAPVTTTFAVQAIKAGQVCSTEVKTITVEALPPSPTCTGTVTSLAFGSGPTVNATTVTGSVSIGLAGSGITGQLAIPGQSSQAVTNGQSVSFTFSRPAAGQPAATQTITLGSLVNGEPCGNRTLTVTVPPLDPPQLTCEGTVTNLVLTTPVITAATVSSNLVMTMTGAGITGILTSTPAETLPAPANGLSHPLTKQRPGPTDPPVSYQYTLTTRVGQQTCGTRTVTLTVQPKDAPPTCEATNPTRIRIDGAYVEEKNRPGDRSVYVWVQVWARTFNGNVGLRWRNGSSWRIKEFAGVNAPCGSAETKVRFDWGPSHEPAHLPSNGAVYDIVSFTGSPENPQNLRSWGNVPAR